MTPPAEPNVGAPGVGVPTPPRRRLFLTLVGLGVVGILGGLPLNVALIAEAAPDEPLAAAVVISSVSLLVPVALGSLAFVALGPRVGLDAPVLRAALERRPWWPQLRAGLPLAAGLAAAGFAVIAALDFTVFDSVRAGIEALDVAFGAHLLASLYGGIVEELLVRAGLMTVLVWLLVVIGRRPRGSAPAWGPQSLPPPSPSAPCTCRPLRWSSSSAR